MEQHVAEALQMLEAFRNVGVKRFSVTQTDIEQRKVDPYWPGVNTAGMRLLLTNAVPRAWERSQNLILRPHPVAGGALAQLDDLDERKLERVRPRAFLTLETSPGNHQAWLFIEGANDEAVRRMVKAMEVDWKASRAVRVAGSPNCKLKYAPDFPMVRIGEIGTKVRLQEIEDWIPPAPPVPVYVPPATTRNPRVFPSYPMCLERAPESASGGKQRTMADFTWCCIAADWGWSAEEIASRLMEVSSKAQENGWKYACETAAAAVARVMQNGPWKKR